MKKVGAKDISTVIEAKRIENIKNESKGLRGDDLRNSRMFAFQTPSIEVDFSNREIEKDKEGMTKIIYRFELKGKPDLLEFGGGMSSTVFKASFSETELLLTSKKYTAEQTRTTGFENRVEDKAIEMVKRIFDALNYVQEELLNFNLRPY